MFKQLLVASYRTLATITVLIPLAVNLTIKGGPVASFIYAPTITLCLLLVAVYFDDKLLQIIKRRKPISTRTATATATAKHKKTPHNCCLIH